MSVREAAAVQFAVPPVDQVLDLHGDPAHHDLALFLHGNQWMAAEALLHEFRAAVPQVQSIYYETLPPGILLEQMRLGALQMGSLVIRVAPDVLTAPIEALQVLVAEGQARRYCEYAANTLAILVRSGNPHGITGWADLLRPEVRLALPDPETEGIGRLIRTAVTGLLGADAWAELAWRKRERGAVLFTRIHHRETPLHLLSGQVDAGPIWLTEALHQAGLGAPVEVVRLPAEQNRRGRYGAAVLERLSRHPEPATAFVSFLRGPAAQAVLADYGFEAPVEA